MLCLPLELPGRCVVRRPASMHTATHKTRPRLRRRIRLLASSSDDNGNSSTAERGDSQIRQTVADLDAILGIEEEEAPEETQDTPDLSQETKEEIQSLAEEVSQKLEEDDKQQQLIKNMTDIVKNAVSDAEKDTDGKDLLKSLERFVEAVNVVKEGSDGEDIQIMKDQVFGADSFWVTEVFVPEDMYGGHRFRGNVRAKSEKEAFESIASKMEELFEDKYEVLMFEEPLTPDQLTEANPKPKVCFQIIPSEIAGPQKSPSWRPVAGGVLFLLTLATSYILGVSSNVGNIPRPVMEFLSRPENLRPEEWPEAIRNWDASSFLISSATVAAGVIGLQLMHDLGHRIMAFLKKIKLKGSLVLPNTQIGTFGSVTQLDGFVKNRQDLWDFAFAGILTGALSSLALMIAGLVISQDPSVPKESLIPVPSLLLQGSTLIGGVLQVALGEAANQRTLYLHPFTIAGLCGLTTAALNALPVGNLDGGRMMLSSFGKRPLTISSLFTYAGLAVGILGSSLALPFGLYVLICQRNPEEYIQNQVTPTERTRQWITGVTIGLAVLTLLPMGLFDGNDAALGPGGPFL